jgi:hypothetical protein
MRTSVSRLGTAHSARRLARGRDHHCLASRAAASILCGINPVGVGTIPSKEGFAALTVATVFCTAATGAEGPVDLNRSGRWATVESRECVSACVTAPSAASDSTAECRGELGVFLKIALRTIGVVGTTGPFAFGCGAMLTRIHSAYESESTEGRNRPGKGGGTPRWRTTW